MKGRQLTNYTQRFRDGKINFIVATFDPTDYVDIYSLNNTLTHFQNLTFLTDPTISASWFINDKWMPFLRGGYSQDGAALLDGSVSVGMGRYFNNSSNLLGFGVGWGSPAQKGLEDQVTTELFYRLQLAQNLALTPDIQVIFNPALNPDQDAIAVFSIRSRINF